MKLIFPYLFLSVFYLDLISQDTITVNPSLQYQVMFGMGGQGTGDSNYVGFLVDNMGLTAYRYYMDGSWSGLDSATSGDISLANITSGVYNFYKTTADISFFQNLKAKGVTNIISTSWSAPICVGGGGCCYCGSISDPTNFGNFMAAFVKDFHNQTGQTIYALNIQNEPLFCEDYASGILDASSFGPVLQQVRAQFTDSEVKNTKFFGPEHMGSYSWNTGSSDQDYIDELLDSPTYGPDIDIYAVHSYLDGVMPDLGSATGWDLFYQAVCVNQHKRLFMSETDWSGQSNDWTTLMGDHSQIFVALKYGKVSAWIYWGMGTFYNNGSTNFAYVCKHYMRFIRPGYKQVEVSTNDSDVAALGFIDTTNNNISLVVVNTNGAKTKTLALNNFKNRPATFNVYRSTSNELCGYVGKISGDTILMPPYSVLTLCYNAAEINWQWGPSPPNIQVTKITSNSITITWSSPKNWVLHSPTGNRIIGIAGYYVYQEGIEATTDGPTTQNTWTFTALQPSTAYNLGIITRDSLYNESSMSQVVVKTTCKSGNCTEQDLQGQYSPIAVFPNPVSDFINLSIPDGGFYNLSIISITGQVVLAKQNVSNQQTIDVSGLTKGIYIVILKSENNTYKTKLAIE